MTIYYRDEVGKQGMKTFKILITILLAVYLFNFLSPINITVILKEKGSPENSFFKIHTFSGQRHLHRGADRRTKEHVYFEKRKFPGDSLRTTRQSPRGMRGTAQPTLRIIINRQPGTQYMLNKHLLK